MAVEDGSSQPPWVRTFFGPTVGWRNVPESEVIVGNTFLALDDTPDSYVGHAGEALVVTETETGLGFGFGVGGTPDWINVKNHGAVGDGVTDDTAAIQAAIDFACSVADESRKVSTIYMPTGNYKISNTIYLDPPNNLRQAPVDITKRINFTLCLMGDETAGSETGATVFKTTFNDKPGLVVGPGQGMVIKNFTIGPAFEMGYRANCPHAIPAVAFVGGGGASRFICANVFAAGFYTGFQTGWTGMAHLDDPGLGDSGTFFKCRTFNCAIGIWINETQNFINSAYDCNIEATTSVITGNGGGLQVFGGNYSSPDGKKGTCAASAISAITATSIGNAFTYTFTATIVPDIYFTGPDGVYNRFVFNTAYFGPVPCYLEAFNSGTNVASFRIYQPWIEYYFGQFNNIVNVANPDCTDIQAEIQACTKVYCAEMITCFQGCQISVHGIHVENNSAPTRLLLSDVTFGDLRPNHLSNIFFNTDSSQFLGSPPFTPTEPNLAGYLIAQTFMFIEMTDTDTTIQDSNLGMVDLCPVGCGGAHLHIHNTVGLRPNLYLGGLGPGGGGRSIIDLYPGMEVDKYLFYHTPIFEFDAQARDGMQIAPYWLYKPAPYSTPAITMANFNILNGALPALNVTTGPLYPMIWGGQVYRKYDTTFVASATRQFVSDHYWYSYGQNITPANVPTCAWTYKGQSPVIYLDTESMKLMRIGLGIILDNGGGDQRYIVTGIHPLAAGGPVHPLKPYITVSKDPVFPRPTVGNKTTIYSGTTIKQDPYVITSF